MDNKHTTQDQQIQHQTDGQPFFARYVETPARIEPEDGIKPKDSEM